MSAQVLGLFVGIVLGALAFDVFASWQAKRKAIRENNQNLGGRYKSVERFKPSNKLKTNTTHRSPFYLELEPMNEPKQQKTVVLLDLIIDLQEQSNRQKLIIDDLRETRNQLLKSNDNLEDQVRLLRSKGVL